MTTQAVIESLLKREIGLDVDSLGSAAIGAAIRRRMAEHALPDLEAYLAQIKASEDELQELVEEVVVLETWFLRDRAPFAFLAHYVTSQWTLTHRGQALRVLCVPCATGEEAYSVAVTLMEAGLGPKEFRVDAADISKGALRKARRAIYGMNSFRGMEAKFRDKYFTRVGKEYRLIESVAGSVNFIQGNLLHNSFLAGARPYDVVFCRNLFIYLDQTARERAIRAVDRLLAVDGVLVVGHAETRQVPDSQFVSIRYPRSFAYRKAVQRAARNSVHSHKSSRLPVLSAAERPGLPVRAVSGSAPVLETAAKTSEPSSDLETARRLADQGQLEEAAAMCHSHLREEGASAEAYFLLGLVHHAWRQEEQAGRFFSKAVYLEPNHHQALLHLALQRERLGDESGAAILRQRAERSVKKSEPRA
ncbi:MAG TPA: protein-glutamate O-methyltransferase CheR [Acidobacteriota bacterium]|jgi:chemotaxis protein methyltransferase WspC